MMQNKDDLLCDLAETYGITDMDSLPVGTLSILACGLPSESRSIRRITGQQFDIKTMLLATIADRLGILCWMQSKDGHKNRNRPKSILDELLNSKKKEAYEAFDSIEEYEAARARILRKGDNE